MSPQKRTRMDKVCGMCGDIGDDKKLATCNRCKETTEHIYCMKEQLFEVPVLWYCEECLQCLSLVHKGEGNASKTQKIFHGDSSHESSKGPSKRSLPLICKVNSGHFCEDKKQTAARKPIYSEDDSHKMLDTCGERKVPALDSPSVNADTHCYSSKRSLPQICKVNSGHFCEDKKQTAARKPIYSEDDAHKMLDTCGERKVSALDSPFVNADTHCSSSKRSLPLICKVNSGHFCEDKKQTAARKPIYSEDDSHKMLDTCRERKVPALDSPSVNANTHGSSSKCIITKQDDSSAKDEKVKKMENSEELPLALTINPDEKLRTNYAPQARWKGRFEILERAHHVYQGIQAHFPHFLHPKVEKISKDLPEKLKFRVLTRKDIWPRIFHLDSPTKEDIGLYFFSCELGRSKDKYIRLLERLDSRDSVLQACMKDVRLLIFSSHQLPVDSQRIDGEAYLWGVFHHSHKGLSRHTKVKCSYSTATATRSNNCDQLSVPMERNPVDISIMTPPCCPAPKSRDFKSIRSPVDKFPLKKVADQVHPDIPPGFSKICPSGFTELRGAKRTKDRAELNVPLDRKPEEVDLVRDGEIDKPNVFIPGIDTPPGFPESHSREFRYVKSSFVELPLKKVANQIDPDMPPGFPELPPPGFPELPSSQCSSHEAMFRGAMPSRMDGTSCVPPTIMEGYSSKGSKPHEVKKECHQATDCGQKSAEHCCCPTHAVEETSSFRSFASPDECSKHHSIRKNLSSLSVQEKVHGSSANSSDERPASSEEGGKDSCESSRDVGRRCEHNSYLNFMRLDLESISAMKRRLLEFKKTTLGKLNEAKVAEERAPQSGLSVQNSQSKSNSGNMQRSLVSVFYNSQSRFHDQRGKSLSSERIPDKANGEGKMQSKTNESPASDTNFGIPSIFP